MAPAGGAPDTAGAGEKPAPGNASVTIAAARADPSQPPSKPSSNWHPHRRTQP